MHVYRDSNQQVYFQHPYAPDYDEGLFDAPPSNVPGAPSGRVPYLYVDVYRGTEKLASDFGPVPAAGWDRYGESMSGKIVTKSPGKYTILLDYKSTSEPGMLRLHWKNERETLSAPVFQGVDPQGNPIFSTAPLRPVTFRRDQFIKVVTPIVPIEVLEAALIDAGVDNSNASSFMTEVYEMENTIRLIIEAYCGTTFTSVRETRLVWGLDGLRRALTNAVEINSIQPPLRADLYSQFTYLTIKQAPPEELMQYVTDGVIRVPKDYYRNTQYSVDATWGSLDIPEPVQEAALILAKEYSCNEKLYRDRYLQVVSYADNRFQFNNGAYRGTGNVKADQLLDNYKRGGMILV